jgi:hypothetical protein
MSHDLVFALCSLALLLGTIWLLVGAVRHSEGLLFSERMVQQLMGQYLDARPHGPGIEFRVAAKSGKPPGGWSRIRRAMRVRQTGRVAASLRERSPV